MFSGRLSAPHWRDLYHQLASQTEGGVDTLNRLIGMAVKALLGATDLGDTPAPECCTLIKSTYMRLDVPPEM